MLQNYVDLLRSGFDALMGLSFENCTLQDYFAAVGYEVLIILLGIVYLAGFALIIAFPFIVYYVIRYIQNVQYVKKYKIKKYDLYYTKSKIEYLLTHNKSKKLHNNISVLFELEKLIKPYENEVLIKDIYKYVHACISNIEKIYSLNQEYIENNIGELKKEPSVQQEIEILAKHLKECNADTKICNYLSQCDEYDSKQTIIRRVIMTIVVIAYILLLLPLFAMIIMSVNPIFIMFVVVFILAFAIVSW